MALYQSITQVIGDTPMVRLSRLEEYYSCHGELYGKCEFLNPGGSLKDRPVVDMIRQAAIEGDLKPGGCVICLSTGAGGVSAAMACAALGVRCRIVAPDTLSLEYHRRMLAYGAEVILSPAGKGMAELRERAGNLAARVPGSFVLDQFHNDENPRSHKSSTGPEILRDVPNVDILVAGIGSGGTVTGCGEYIKMRRPDCLVVGVEPEDSPVISGGDPARHELTGIGIGFVPDTLNRYILDKVVKVRTKDALATTRNLALIEGILCGPSSGAALAAAVFLAQQLRMGGRKIVAILPDRGDSYLERDFYGKKA